MRAEDPSPSPQQMSSARSAVLGPRVRTTGPPGAPKAISTAARDRKPVARHYESAETRPMDVVRPTGYTGHRPTRPAIQRLDMPSLDDVEDEQLSKSIGNSAVANGVGVRPLTATVSDFAALTNVGGGGARGGGGGGGAKAPSRGGQARTRTAPAGAARNIFAGPLVEKREKAVAEERFHVPGYGGHVPSEKFKFANSKGAITRHILTKPEMQESGFLPNQAVEKGQTGRALGDVEDEYFKLPGSKRGSSKTEALELARTGKAAPTKGYPGSNLTYSWSGRVPLKTLPPEPKPTLPDGWPLKTKENADQRLVNETAGAQDNVPRHGSVYKPLPKDSVDDKRHRREKALGGIQLSRHLEKRNTSHVDQQVGSKAGRLVARAAAKERMLAKEREQADKAAFVRDPATGTHPRPFKDGSVVPEFDVEATKPAATGHVPGYAGHVAKRATAIETTTGMRSLRNFKNPYGVGSGRTNEAVGSDARAGIDPETTLHLAAQYKGKKEACFDDDETLTKTLPQDRSRKEAWKTGRTHFAFDPAVHTDTKKNVITDGRGAHHEMNERVRTRKNPDGRVLVPGYTGHTAGLKTKFGNTYGDQTAHMLTKEGRKIKPTGDIPFRPKKGDLREGYGYFKLENCIESKNADTLERARRDIDPKKGRAVEAPAGYTGHRPISLSRTHLTAGAV